MARTTGPLFSQEASGTIANLATHSSWKGRSYVRQRVTPTDPKSPTQVSVRTMLAWITTQWNAGLISDAEKATWTDKAKQLNVPPFNAFLKEGLEAWTQEAGPSHVTPNTNSGTPGSFNAGLWSLTALVKSIRHDWTNGLAANAWGLLIFREPGATCTPSRANLVHIAPMLPTGPATWTDQPLAAGQYAYRVWRLAAQGAILKSPTATKTATVL